MALRSDEQSILFADPQDLLTDQPDIMYGILHATDSHRTLFPRPVLNVDSAVHTLTSAANTLGPLPPYIADPFALGTSSNIFPDLANCIALKNSRATAAYNLAVQTANDLLLDPPITDFHLDAVTRVLQGDGNFKNAVQTAGSSLAPATASLLLDTANQKWGMAISQLSSLNLDAAGAEISRVAGFIQSTESQLMSFGQALAGDLSQVPQLIMGAALAEVQKLVAFLTSLGILPALKVAMTNSWALTMSTSMGYDEFLTKIPPGPVHDFIEDFVTDFDLALKAITGLTSADFTLSLTLGVKVPTSFGPTALGLAGFALDVGTSAGGVAVRLDLGVGIGVNFDAGPFHALGYFGYTQSVYKAPNAWGVGSTATIKAHVDLVVASADLCIEATIALIAGTCMIPVNGVEEKTETDTIWGYAQVAIAIDVSIFWVINVHVHEKAEWTNNFNGGPCTLAALSSGGIATPGGGGTGGP